MIYTLAPDMSCRKAVRKTDSGCAKSSAGDGPSIRILLFIFVRVLWLRASGRVLRHDSKGAILVLAHDLTRPNRVNLIAPARSARRYHLIVFIAGKIGSKPLAG